MFRPYYHPTENTLIECNPLVIIPPLAAQIGLNNALFLQQLHYWLQHNCEMESHKLQQKHFHDGRWWCFNTYNDWRCQNFPFWNERTIKRIVDDLRERGFIITTSKYNKRARDRTFWYTLDYDALIASHRLLENATPDRAVPQLGYREETAEDWLAYHIARGNAAQEAQHTPKCEPTAEELEALNMLFQSYELPDDERSSSNSDASMLLSGVNGGASIPCEE